MIKPWEVLCEDIRKRREAIDSDKFASALISIEQLAQFIADGPLRQALFGWTSMNDLCMQQTDSTPYSGPYLRISPHPSGSVDFEYVDTGIKQRRWKRTTSPEDTMTKLLTFLDQLRWISASVSRESDAGEKETAS